MSIDIGLNTEQRNGLVEILTQLLADEFTLYTKTRKSHWNIFGKDFYSLHQLFQSQYEELAEIVDNVAERIRVLGSFTIGTLEEFKSKTEIIERPGVYEKQEKLIQDLLSDHEIIIRFLRAKIPEADQKFKDAGTTDFLTGIIQIHEKTSWILRVQLED
jgi:starvation-inducible DNA-binding protein